MQISQIKKLLYISESSPTLPMGSAKMGRPCSPKPSLSLTPCLSLISGFATRACAYLPSCFSQKHICFFKSQRRSPQCLLVGLAGFSSHIKIIKVKFLIGPLVYVTHYHRTEGRKPQLKIILMLSLSHVFTQRNN